jgi:hypothetical protein
VDEQRIAFHHAQLTKAFDQPFKRQHSSSIIKVVSL